NQMEQAAATARTIAAMRAGAAVLSDAGRALLEARQYASAKELLEKAVAADPTAGLDLDLAIAAFQTAGAAEGLRRMDRVPTSRRNADYYLARAQMLAASDRGGDAIAAIDEAIRSDPKRADLYWEAAVLKPVTDALELLDRAAKLLPQDQQIPLIKATV